MGLNLQFTVCVLYLALKTSLLCVRSLCLLFAIKHSGNHLYFASGMFWVETLLSDHLSESTVFPGPPDGRLGQVWLYIQIENTLQTHVYRCIGYVHKHDRLSWAHELAETLSSGLRCYKSPDRKLCTQVLNLSINLLLFCVCKSQIVMQCWGQGSYKSSIQAWG